MGSFAGPPGSTGSRGSSSDRTAGRWGKTEHTTRAYRPSKEKEGGGSDIREEKMTLLVVSS